MSERNNDRSGRFRNRFIGLRASDEEAALIAHMAQISGMCKQDYILSRALKRTLVVEPSVKVEKALRKRLEALCDELSRIEDAGQMTQELQDEKTLYSLLEQYYKEEYAIKRHFTPV